MPLVPPSARPLALPSLTHGQMAMLRHLLTRKTTKVVPFLSLPSLSPTVLQHTQQQAAVRGRAAPRSM